MARKAGKIYGTERDATSKPTVINSGGNTGGVGGGGVGIGGGGSLVGSSVNTGVGSNIGNNANVPSKNTNGSN